MTDYGTMLTKVWWSLIHRGVSGTLTVALDAVVLDRQIGFVNKECALQSSLQAKDNHERL